MRVLSFDPGIDFMGWSVIDVSETDEVCRVVACGTLLGKDYYKEHPMPLRKKFKRPFIILQSYKKVFRDLISEYKPDAVVSEGAFAHTFIAAAFSLITIIHVLRQACFDVTEKDIHIVAPMQTKVTLTGKSMADKDLIKASVHAHKDIILPKDTSGLSEHSYDAIGHGYCYIQMVLHPEKFPAKKKKKRKVNKK